MVKFKDRVIMCFVGRTNVGKSSLLNILSGQKDYAIVDTTPGTTADTVTTVMEIHGLGPCKILDTAGMDEYSELGEKKRKKTIEAIEEADLSIIVIDLLNAAETQDLTIETEIIERAEKHGKQILIIYNLFKYEEVDECAIEKSRRLVDRLLGGMHPSIVVDATDMSQQLMIATFINTFFQHKIHTIDLLPSLKNTGYVLLIVPMDEETPILRLLRPQDMAVERILRNYATPVLFRPDLNKARSPDPKVASEERARFERLLEHLSSSDEGLQLVITDSQAFDAVSNWIPKEIPFTSFSIMMTNYMSFGNLELFIEGVKTVDSLKSHDNILIVEACNHSRKCNDIGTVQIPRLLKERIGGNINIDFSFGRTYPEKVGKYKLIVHCGACMIDRQKYARRIVKAKEAGVPITNYGILLSYLKSEDVLQRAVQPFGITPNYTPCPQGAFRG
jgi:small GTP-binding protein